MKTRLVIWGKKGDERQLIAMDLNVGANKVTVYNFPADAITQEFDDKISTEWKNGEDIAFPDVTEKTETELSTSSSLLPTGISADDEGLINKTQAEWNYIVLSARMHSAYDQELKDIEEKVSALEDYQDNMWDTLKEFWEKVQKQIQERTLFREHSDNLRQRTNRLFDELKVLRKKLDDSFRQTSTDMAESFKSSIAEIESRIEGGLSLQPIFEELKKLQKKFNEAKLTKGDRGRVWDKLDAAFKNLKEKRYGAGGTNSVNNTQGTERIDKRIEGLKAAITKMEGSIAWDEKDLVFENKRANDSAGQLEIQIRQAKINMIEERISSKKLKLEDMNKTLNQLDKKKESILAKIQSDSERQKVKEVKKEIESKIKSEIEEKKAELESDETVLKAAAQIASVSETVKETSEEVVEKTQKTAETTADKIASTFDKVEDKVEDVVDSAVEKGKSAMDKISNVLANAKDKLEDAVDAAGDKWDELEDKVEDALEDETTMLGKIAQKAKSIVEDAKDKVEDIIDDIKDRMDDDKDEKK